MSKTDTGVTVQSIRTANGKLISASHGSSHTALAPASVPSQRVTSHLKDVATGGKLAMQVLRKQPA